MKVPTMVLGLEVTVSLLDAIMAAVGVLVYDGAIVLIIIMLYRLLRRGDRQDRTIRKVNQRVLDLELAQDSEHMLDRGPSIPRMPWMPRMPRGWRRQQDDPSRSDSYGDLSLGAGDDSYPPQQQQQQQQRVERQAARPSRPSYGPQGHQGQQRGTFPPPRRTAPPIPLDSPESSDGQWEYPPDDSLGGAERQRRTNNPIGFWMDRR
jgi:hypothetical protein